MCHLIGGRKTNRLGKPYSKDSFKTTINATMQVPSKEVIIFNQGRNKETVICKDLSLEKTFKVEFTKKGNIEDLTKEVLFAALDKRKQKL